MVLTICLLIQLIICFRVLRYNQISPLLRISLAVAIFIWYFIPGALAAIFQYEAITSTLYYNVSEYDFIYTYFLETTALSFVLLGFLISLKKLPKIKKAELSATKVSGIFVSSIALLFLAYLVYQYNQSNFVYLENNSAALYDERKTTSIVYLLGRLLFSATMVLTTLAAPRSRAYYVCFALVCADSLLAVLSGGRIAFLSPLIVILFRYVNFMGLKLRAKSFVLGVAAATFVVTLVLPMSYSISALRSTGKFEISALFDRSPARHTSNASVKMIFQKFDSFSAGFSLLNQGGGMGYAGLEPYYGSALVFIPRSFWPDRPVAGSLDGTIYGHPTRLVPSVLGIASDSYNVGISSLATTFWQLGFIGFPFFILSGVGFLFFINKLLLSSYFSNKVMGMYLLSIPSFHLLLPSPDAMLKQSVVAIIILMSIKLYRHHRQHMVRYTHEKNTSTY